MNSDIVGVGFTQADFLAPAIASALAFSRERSAAGSNPYAAVSGLLPRLRLLAMTMGGGEIKNPAHGWVFNLAERVGFEPTDPLESPVFKTGAFGRSATSPIRAAIIPTLKRSAIAKSVYFLAFVSSCF